MDVITIATFAKPEEAHLGRLRLERDGIPAYVADEHVLQLDWKLTNALGGVRLMVAEDDVEEALGILKAEPVCTEADAINSVTCPRCENQQPEFYLRPRRMMMLSLFFPLPWLFFTRWHRWKCQECDHTWR
ncbi:MAG TPA: DUF2007 domain-containing protein [Candidatus Saccharimonadia bacterium]|nr:DUF2007 domain-containing protein [Candidatus Saccharimonadia bacterium]